jgi:hypothetical protein
MRPPTEAGLFIILSEHFAGSWIDQMNARTSKAFNRHIVIAAARGGIISDKTLDVQASVGAAVEKRGHRTRNKADPYLVGFVPNQN